MPLRHAVRDLIIRTATLSGLDRLQRGRVARGGGSRLVQVVNLHGTPRASADSFRRQLDWVCENFTVIDFETLARSWDRREAPPKGDEPPALLFTFDDSLASNHDVAAPILEAAGLRAVFFVIPGFVQFHSEDPQRFFSEHVSRHNGAAQLPEESWKPMSPDQVADLDARGHTIGNHTFSHACLSSLRPSAQYREIVDAAELLRTWIKKRVDTFAWTYGWNTIDATALRIVRETHRFCFAACPGTVELGFDSPALIWRTNVEPYYAPHEYRFFYSGLTNPFWAHRRRRLRALLAEAEDVVLGEESA
jgi:peptidoglycan/xylan/chitin deacetylase (PgdA/CDA1 family)